MKCNDYIAQFLEKKQITQLFGIPGGCVLEFMDACRRNTTLNMHLGIHEQSSGYAALGYAQTSGKPSLVYVTKGPGLTNVITPIADAYFDSIPVLFITAHGTRYENNGKRIFALQEFDTLSLVKPFTKYAARIENIEEVPSVLENAVKTMVSDRPGPVFLDFLSSLFRCEINFAVKTTDENYDKSRDENYDNNFFIISKALQEAKKPVLLVGNGVHSAHTENEFVNYAEKTGVPVVSSLCGMDIYAGGKYYFGHIGSHGTKTANRIIYEADLIVAFGNRLDFSPKSTTFGNVANTKLIRVEVDSNELDDRFPNETCLLTDLKSFMPYLSAQSQYIDKTDWLEQCKSYKTEYSLSDADSPIIQFSDLIKNIPGDNVITADVGNNKILLCYAYEHAGCKNRILFSQSLEAAGNSLPKAIGAYYATGKPVVSISGDQGFMFNLQELHFIAKNNLPIRIIIVNNHKSGAIHFSQKQSGLEGFQTSLKDGYSHCDFQKIARAFGVGIEEFSFDEGKYSLPYIPRGNMGWEFEYSV